MFEYFIYKDNQVCKKQVDDNEITSLVSEKWVNWNQLRNSQILKTNEIKPYIDLDYQPRYKKDQTWRSDKHLNRVYSLKESHQSFIWKNVYNDLSKLVDIQENGQSTDLTTQLEDFLGSSFKKIHLGNTIDQAINYLDTTGEACLFIGWKKIQSTSKKPIEELTPEDNIVNIGKRFATVISESTSSPNIEVINPLNLVIEPGVNPDNIDSFNKASKIIKNWKSVDDILNNKTYKLSKEQQEALRNISFATNESDLDENQYLNRETFNNKVEVLDYWGDIKLKDGTYLRDYHITVANRGILLAFETNPFVINPIINAAITRDSDTFRGIPVLYSILDITDLEQEEINLIIDNQAMVFNPARFVPSTFFEGDVIKLEPGKLLKYNKQSQDPNSIIEIGNNLINADALVTFSDKVIQETSHINGNQISPQKVQTATETKINAVSNDIVNYKTVDMLKQNLIVPMCEKVIELYKQINGLDFNVDFTYDSYDITDSQYTNISTLLQVTELAAQTQIGNQIDYRSLYEKIINLLGFQVGQVLFPDQVGEVSAMITSLPVEVQKNIIQFANESLVQYQNALQLEKIRTSVENSYQRSQMNEELKQTGTLDNKQVRDSSGNVMDVPPITPESQMTEDGNIRYGSS
jgi:hypothetical protein